MKYSTPDLTKLVQAMVDNNLKRDALTFFIKDNGTTPFGKRRRATSFKKGGPARLVLEFSTPAPCPSGSTCYSGRSGGLWREAENWSNGERPGFPVTASVSDSTARVQSLAAGAARRIELRGRARLEVRDTALLQLGPASDRVYASYCGAHTAEARAAGTEAAWRECHVA